MIFSISITFHILVIIIIIIIIIITVKWNPLFHFIFEMYYVHSFTDVPISLFITCIFKSIQKMSSIHYSLYYVYICICIFFYNTIQYNPTHLLISLYSIVHIFVICQYNKILYSSLNHTWVSQHLYIIYQPFIFHSYNQ